MTYTFEDEIELGGNSFLLTVDFDLGAKGVSNLQWRWCGKSDFMTPSMELQQSLNGEFVKHRAVELSHRLDMNQRFGLTALLKKFKASNALSEMPELQILAGALDFVEQQEVKQDFNSREKETPLHKLGYKVGSSGAETSLRLDILKTAFETEEGEMDSWGPRCSEERLRRISSHLAFLCRENQSSLARRKAVADWKHDLDWLERQYYRRSMAFPWPGSE